MTSHANGAEPLPRSLRYRPDGPVGILELHLPEKRNALSDELVAAIGRFFAAPPPEVRAVVLCAAGEHFSAGLDLTQVADWDPARGLRSSMTWHRAFEALEFGAVPVVAVLKGAVIGGGLELASAAHLRVAERTAYYALPEGQRGIFLGGGGSVRLPRLVGTACVMDMLLTGRVHDAESGLALGFSQYVVDAGAGLARGLELAQRIAANAPMSNFAAMHALPRIAQSPPAAGFFSEAAIAAIAQSTPEAKQRVEDFLAKRAGKVTRT